MCLEKKGTLEVTLLRFQLVFKCKNHVLKCIIAEILASETNCLAEILISYREIFSFPWTEYIFPISGAKKAFGFWCLISDFGDNMRVLYVSNAIINCERIMAVF